MSDTGTPTVGLADLRQALAAGRYDRVEELWLAACEHLDGEAGPYLEVARALAAAGERERAVALLLTLAPPLREAGRTSDALEALREALRVAPRDKTLREEMRTALRAHYQGREGLEIFLERAGLPGDRVPTAQAVEAFERYMTFQAGDYAFHASGWGVGRVRGVDATLDQVRIDFEGRRGHLMTVEGAVTSLQRLPLGHLWVRQREDREALLALATESPVEVVRLTLQSLARPMALRELRAEIAGPVVEAKAWSAFWGKAREAIKHDRFIEMKGPPTNPTLSLRTRPVEFEEGARARMAAARMRSLEDELSHVEGLLKEGATALVLEAALQIEAGRDRPAVRLLTAKLLGAAAGDDAAVGAADALLRAAPDPGRVIGELPGEAIQVRALTRLRALAGESWRDVLGAAFLQVAPGAPMAALAEALEGDGAPETLRGALEKVLALGAADPDRYLWVLRAVFAGRYSRAVDGTGRPSRPPLNRFDLLVRFLQQLDGLAREEGEGADRKAVGRMRTAFGAGDFAWMRQVLDGANLDDARRLFQLSLYNKGITEKGVEGVRLLIFHSHPEAISSEASSRGEAEEEVILVSRRGLAARQAEFDHVMHVDIPENQADIGRAAGFGDLSENAEYTAALERQRFLTTRANEMRQSLERARVLEAEGLDFSRAGPGTEVSCLNLGTGAREVYHILGPWDVDQGHGVISYQAPLARGLRGRLPGEETDVELPGGTVRLRVEGVRRSDRL
ncbi:MAG: GreA/GreB family elongation factor [Planctomycetes bacterium]|nr:GreA/GreB family elongation factor [Planctomycetota bacterium]